MAAATARGIFHVYRVIGYLLIVCCLYINVQGSERQDITVLRHIHPILFVKENIVKVKVKQETLKAGNKLEFDSPNYNFEVNETAQNQEFVGTVTATNPDGAATITYSLSNVDPKDMFKIDNDGIIRIWRVGLDQLEWQYNFTAHAAAQGYKGDAADIIVDITDVNQYSPVFNASTYEANVQENITIGEIIIQVFATDQDHGMNGEVHYSLESSSDPFSIDRNTGIINTTDKLDRENKDSYTLVVIGEDGAISPNKGSCIVSVTVNDINDNLPYFGSDGILSVNVPENTHVGTAIAIDLDVQDNDTTANEWKYTITSGNEDNYFIMDNTTGTVFLDKPLDYDNATREFSLKVSVSDGFHRPINTTIEMTVINDIPTTAEPSTKLPATETTTEISQGLSCYSCGNCGEMDENTTVIQSTDYTACTTTFLLHLGDGSVVIRGASTSEHVDGECLVEDNAITCYCSTSLCNNEPYNPSAAS